MVSWEDLRLFLAVSRTGSATAAAQSLGLSQPTVSRRLAVLARDLGVEVLRAGARGYDLTPAGQVLRARAEAMDREILAALRAMDRIDTRPGGAVRLTAPEGLGLAVLAPRLDAFARDNPGIDLVLVAEAQVANLSRREADLALRFARPHQRDLIMKRIAVVPYAPYASPRYLRRHPRPPGDGLVPGDELVALHESLVKSPEAAWVGAQASQHPVRVRVRTPLALRSAVLAGAGVGILPDYLGAIPGLRRLGTGPALHRDLFLVYHRARRDLERVRIVARFVTECVEQWHPA